MNKRDFYRTDIGSIEKSIGGLILTLLIAIGVGIVYKGTSFDPAMYTGDPEAMESTRSAVEGKAATVRGVSDLRAYELAGGNGAVDAPEVGITSAVQGLTAMGPTEFYDSDTLYEKINGRAPAYLEFNFQELTSRSFSLEGRGDQFIDAYLYRMDTPINAFGIFSIERSEVGGILDFIADGYRSGMGYFMRHGTTYIQVLASSSEADVMTKAEALARELVAAIPENNEGLEGRFLLPSESQIPGSLTYISTDAYGQSALSQVFEAKYEVAGSELIFFTQSSADVGTARENWEAVREFYSKYGSIESSPQMGDLDVFVSESFGQWNIILTTDTTVAGVVNATDKEAAIEFIKTRFAPAVEDAEEEFDY